MDQELNFKTGESRKQAEFFINDYRSMQHTFIDDFSSEASYCAVLFINPRIRCSNDPESAPFRALTKSYNNKQRQV